jgi:type III secretion protein S
MQVSDLSSVLIQALIVTLWLSLPTILVASIVGTIFSLLQALTQIQEQTLSYAIKLISVAAVLYITARWMGAEIFNFAVAMFDSFPLMVR